MKEARMYQLWVYLKIQTSKQEKVQIASLSKRKYYSYFTVLFSMGFFF